MTSGRLATARCRRGALPQTVEVLLWTLSDIKYYSIKMLLNNDLMLENLLLVLRYSRTWRTRYITVEVCIAYLHTSLAYLHSSTFAGTNTLNTLL